MNNRQTEGIPTKDGMPPCVFEIMVLAKFLKIAQLQAITYREVALFGNVLRRNTAPRVLRRCNRGQNANQQAALFRDSRMTGGQNQVATVFICRLIDICLDPAFRTFLHQLHKVCNIACISKITEGIHDVPVVHSSPCQYAPGLTLLRCIGVHLRVFIKKCIVGEFVKLMKIQVLVPYIVTVQRRHPIGKPRVVIGSLKSFQKPI